MSGGDPGQHGNYSCAVACKYFLMLPAVGTGSRPLLTAVGFHMLGDAFDGWLRRGHPWSSVAFYLALATDTMFLTCARKASLCAA